MKLEKRTNHVTLTLQTNTGEAHSVGTDYHAELNELLARAAQFVDLEIRALCLLKFHPGPPRTATEAQRRHADPLHEFRVEPKP